MHTQSTLVGSFVGIALCLILHRLLTRKRRNKKCDLQASGELVIRDLDLRRKAAIGLGKATDHAHEIILQADNDFDLNRTIFKNVESKITRLFLKSKLGIKIFWSEDSVQVYNNSYVTRVPRAPNHDKPLLEFMHQECDFKMEHADGSFMDHLQFCYEYSAAHYRGYSPKVLFLHSIMGVGTNFFPMNKEKIPDLKELLTEFEMKHIASFPSILRLLLTEKFINEISSYDVAKLEMLSEVKFHRVIDNEVIALTGDDLWIHLNYQLIHLLDFIPVSNWLVQTDDVTFATFMALYQLLKDKGKLSVGLDFDLNSGESTKEGLPVTLGSLLNGLVPSKVKRTLGINLIKGYSDKIKHDLSYELEFR